MKERHDDSKLPSNPEEVEDLRRVDSSANPLIAFTYIELKIITSNFRPDHVLGGGGFGSVYKGFISQELREGLPSLPVAVKVHDGDNSHQGHREWLVYILFYFNLLYIIYRYIRIIVLNSGHVNECSHILIFTSIVENRD
jgi:hypothetical protein